MNVTESCHLNVLLSWILGPARDEHYQVTDGAALEAAVQLADRANKRLAAGWMPAQVAARWPDRQLERKRGEGRYKTPDGRKITVTTPKPKRTTRRK